MIELFCIDTTERALFGRLIGVVSGVLELGSDSHAYKDLLNQLLPFVNKIGSAVQNFHCCKFISITTRNVGVGT